MSSLKIHLRSAICLVALLGVAGLSGCGRSPATVSGTVTYQGKNLKGGTVAFISTEGEPGGNATIKEDGSYEASLKSGHYKIIVDTESLLPKSSMAGKSSPSIPKDKKTMGPPPGANVPEGYKPMNIADADAAAKENAKRYVKIPQNYSKPEESGLEYTAVGGAQTHNIELK